LPVKRECGGPLLDTVICSKQVSSGCSRTGKIWIGEKMKGKQKVIECLNEALFLELGAVNQYWLHYRLLDDWGFAKLAKKEREESIEEMQHADKLVERIIFLEGHPNLQTVASLRIGQTVKEVLEADLAGENEAWTAYTKSRDICEQEGDYVTKNLFEELIADEEGHIDFLETQLELIEKLGEEKYGLLNAASADEQE
jgi:bacterioferritin